MGSLFYPLVHMILLMKVPYYIYYYNFIVYFEIRQCGISSFLKLIILLIYFIRGKLAFSFISEVQNQVLLIYHHIPKYFADFCLWHRNFCFTVFFFLNNGLAQLLSYLFLDICCGLFNTITIVILFSNSLLIHKKYKWCFHIDFAYIKPTKIIY